jgi:hypothetical protein
MRKWLGYFLEVLMKFMGRFMLAAALLGIAASGQAWALCEVGDNVSSTVTPQGAGVWLYDFSVLNGCNTVNQPFLSDFYIPYFADAGIANITMPTPTLDTPVSWTYSIDPTTDLFGLGTGVIDFHAATPVGYNQYEGFTYTANYAGVKGPFAMDLTTGRLFGDPMIPGSPDTLAALNGAAVPEPKWSGIAVLAPAFALGCTGRRKLNPR